MTPGARPSVRVLVVDDHTALRIGMRAIIRSMSGAVLAGEAADGESALEKYRELLPDVVTLDLRMPKMEGRLVAESILRMNPKANILVMTMYEGEEDVVQSLRVGAKGYILKSAPRREIIDAILAVSRGERYIPANLAGKVAAYTSTPGITPREREVLEQLQLGLSNKEIAEALSVGPGTVKTHVAEIMAKLGAASRTEAVTLAVARGLLK